MLRLAFDFIITWRETRTRPNAYGFSCENAFGNAAGTGFYYGQLAVGVPVALQDACILCI